MANYSFKKPMVTPLIVKYTESLILKKSKTKALSNLIGILIVIGENDKSFFIFIWHDKWNGQLGARLNSIHIATFGYIFTVDWILFSKLRNSDKTKQIQEYFQSNKADFVFESSSQKLKASEGF